MSGRFRPPRSARSNASADAKTNSGQRCTAVKRLLVHQAVLGDFTERLVAKTR
ncbi:MAG: aldehyde dehydrogenase family protein, partial [Betaproteobacteria bacterium]|nr:aldehyde dehydrogenase family protein [Betaproteobacteria bacterium]